MPAKIQANLSLAAFGTCVILCHTVLGCPLSSLTLHMTARKFGFAMQLQAPTVGTGHRQCSAWPHACTT